MSEYYTLITDVGKKKLADAVAHKTTVELVAFAVGDSNGTDYDPTGAETSLKNEVFRGLINSKDIDPDNPKQIRLELIIPATTGGWYIREIGLYDSEKDLFAIAKYPATYKPSPDEGSILKQFIIKAYLLVVNTDNVTLTIKAENLATRDYVDNTLKANQKEVDEGVNDNKYVTPKTLHNKKATVENLGIVRFATDEEVINPKIDNVVLSPKNILPLIKIKPKSLTTDLFADYSITIEKIADGNVSPTKMQKHIPFEFSEVNIPRNDGNHLVFNQHALGIESADKSQYSAILFDDFDRPKLSAMNGNTKIAVIQDIVNNGIGIVADGGSWIKFANGLIIQKFSLYLNQGEIAKAITLPVAYSNKDSFNAFANINSASISAPYDLYGVMASRPNNTQLNIFINKQLSDNSEVLISVFCIGI